VYATYRAINIPRRLAAIIVDGAFARLYLKLCGVSMGIRCEFHGLPRIVRARSAIIRIGNSVTINSRLTSNALGLPQPTILSSVGSRSVLEIGDGSGISGASIVTTESIRIGRNVLIGAGAALWDSDFHSLDPTRRSGDPPTGVCAGPIIIEDDVFIGARSIILKGVKIGKGAVIGAGAVVANDIAPYSVAVGNPARVIRVLSQSCRE
jgi:acetyltransferase-like isoleucine patch superfamily enzyme